MQSRSSTAVDVWALPAALERSRSGRGGHVWLFFEEAIPAALARRLGSHLLTEAMEDRPDIGLDSYDRLFPNQDTMPQGGFGNLIALAVAARTARSGQQRFRRRAICVPWADQWAFLAGVSQDRPNRGRTIVQDAERRGRVLGVRLPPQDDGDVEPWTAPPSRRRRSRRFVGESASKRWNSSSAIRSTSPRKGCTRPPKPPAAARGISESRVLQGAGDAAVHLRQAARHRLRRGSSSAHRFAARVPGRHSQLLTDLGIRSVLRDERTAAAFWMSRFTASCDAEQQAAADAMLAHDTGVLAATTAFGKTVIAAWLIAQRG